MAATSTVACGFSARKSIRTRPDSTNSQTCQPSQLKPACGVITLTGYGISVRVDRGHLVLDDGIGNERRQTRLPRVAHLGGHLIRGEIRPHVPGAGQLRERSAARLHTARRRGGGDDSSGPD